MTQPKQVKTLLFSLLAIFCVTAAWLWLTRSPAAQVMATNPVPSVSSPAPNGSQQAPVISSAGAAPAAVLAAAPPAATPPRFLGNAFVPRPGVPPAIEDRWATAVNLREVGTSVPADPDYRRRVRLVRTDFKYPLVRLEETLYFDSKSGAEILVEQTGMVADHMVVKLAAGVDVQTLATWVTAKGGTIRSVKPAARVYLVTVAAPLDIDGLPAAIEALKAASGVITIAEPDFIVHATTTPNDASFAQLWGMHNTGQTGGVADADIDAPEAWSLTTGSRSVRVGIIDSGIDYNHPDLAANIWTNPREIPGNGIDDDRNGYADDVRGWDFYNNDSDPMDDDKHGTHCAGTIGGVGNNGTGVAGVNWQVSLVALKFLNSSGSGYTSDAVEAIAYANTLNLDLTSNSWGGDGFSQALYDVIAAANRSGHLFIAAAGNDTLNIDSTPDYPSSFGLPNIISVAATDHSDRLASFSNYGPNSVDLAAPGEYIYSTTPGSGYQSLRGTSMATPHVAGAAALLKAYNPGALATEIKSALLGSVDIVPALAGKSVTGGRLNVNAALRRLGKAPSMSFDPVDPIQETRGSVTATLRLQPAPATPLTVQFLSSAPALVPSPARVVVPAGGTSISVPLSIIDNTTIDGTRDVVITPSASGYTATALSLQVNDNDSATLSLQLPSSVAEGAGTITGQATLTLSAAAAVPITVSLSSSDTTELQVPATVTIPAGASSVGFALTVPDDGLIDGTQSATVTATVTNYTSGTATVQVTDNEARSLTLTLPATVNEGGYATYATLTLPGKTVAPLTVTFATSDATELRAPSPITVPAGESSVTYINCQVVDDTVLDGAQTVTLTASAPGFTSGSASISVQDNEPATAVWSTIASPQTAGTVLSATLTLKTIDGNVANFYGYVPITAVNAAGTAKLSDASANFYFSGGVCTVSFSVLSAGTQTKLRAQFASLPLAESNPFTVQSAGMAGFGISSLTSPQVVGVPSTITLTAQDAYGNTVSSFNGSANLAAGTPGTITGVGTSTSSSYPLFSYGSAVSRTQAIYTPAEVGGAGQLSSLALQMLTAPGQAVSNWTIRLKHFSSTTTSGWESTGWTTVLQGTSDLTSAGPGWVEFPFTTPFAYDGSSNLMVDFSYNNGSYSFQSPAAVQTSNIGTPRLRYYAASYNNYGDPLLWSGTTQYSYTDLSVPNLRLNRTASVAVAPATAGKFTAGVWTGPVTFNTVSATPVTLQVRQGTALGQSNSFTLQAPPSLDLTPTDTFKLSGPRGSDFTTQSRTYTLTNISAASITWTATNPATWLTLSSPGGTLAAGASTPLTVTPTAGAALLASGSYTADLIFKVGGVAPASRRVELSVIASGELAVTPATGLSPTGLVGGPFTPATATWTLSNPGDAAISWTAAKTQSWLTLSSTGGTLAPSASVTLTASLNATANTLPVAVYAETITITNATNGRGNTTRPATLTVVSPPDTDSDGMPDAWETAHGLAPASSADINGTLGDPDRDGFTNLLEYAFGLDPQKAEVTPPYSVQTATNPSTGQAELRFTYRRLLAPGGLTYSLLTSTDLITWQKPVPQPAELSATPNPDNTTATVIARIPLVEKSLFVRIKIETP